MKVVVVGDYGVGKTSLLLAVTTGNFLMTPPDTIRNQLFEEIFDGELEQLQLWDWIMTDLDRFIEKQQRFCDCDVFLLCYSITSRGSFSNIEQKWKPEIDYYAPGVPIFLIGTKLDCRHDTETIQFENKGETIISYYEGLEMAKKIGAVAFMECSAKTRKGIRAIFRETTRLEKKGEVLEKSDLCSTM